MRPWATTPLPSLKRSGRMPVKTTGIVLAVSVTLKRTVSASLSRSTLPASTSPPMRNGRSFGASFAATCVGVKKNTRFDWNAFSTSAVATPRPATPAAIHNALLVLGFKVLLLLDSPQRAGTSQAQRDQLRGYRDRRGAVRHPDEVIVAHGFVTPAAAPAALGRGPFSRTHRVRLSRSRMTERTRTSDAPIAYIQHASAINSMPQSIATCIDVPLKLTLDPWCRVFHQCTEK